MNKFANATGQKVTVDFSKQSIINYHVYGETSCVIDFQCCEIADVPGLVYVNFVPKGKRAIRSIAVHQDSIY